MSDEEEEETQQTNKFLGQRIVFYPVLKVDWRTENSRKGGLHCKEPMRFTNTWVKAYALKVLGGDP